MNPGASGKHDDRHRTGRRHRFGGAGGVRLLAALLLLQALAAGTQGHPVDPQPALHVIGNDGPGMQLGYAVAALGDLDGDGHDDFGTTNRVGGKFRIYSGRDGSVLLGNLAAYGTGSSIAGGGDLDGDGVPDVVICAPNSPDHLRAISGATLTTLYSFGLSGPGGWFGWSCAILSDVDGDGLDDLVVGAPLQSIPGSQGTDFDVGRVHVLSGADGSPLYTLDGLSEDDRFGWSVAAVGDIDADGAVDFIVGAPQTHGGVDGYARVYSGADGALLHAFHGLPGDKLLGTSVAGAGDVDADGTPDVIVGDPGHTDNVPFGGLARVYSGADGSVLFELRGTKAGDRLGTAVSGGADVDADGFDDVIVTGQGQSDEVPFAWVVSSREVEIVRRFRYALPNVSNDQGPAAVFGGDVNADGATDVLIGVPNAYGGGALFILGRGAEAWIDQGGSLPSAHGTPALEGLGVLAYGQTPALRLRDAAPLAPVVLVVGTSLAGLPLSGGTLVPAPDLLVHGLVTDAHGRLRVQSDWPPFIPPGQHWTFQAWVADASAPAGLAASNALTGTTQ